MVMYPAKEKTMEAVERIRLAFPGDMKHLLDLKKAGATDVILENAETSLQLGSKLLKGFGVMSDDVNFIRQLVRNSMEQQAQDTYDKTGEPGSFVMKPFQVRVKDNA